MIISIDLGTSSCNAIKFDRNGDIQDKTTKKYENAIMDGERAEQSPETWKKTVLETLKNINPEDAEAIAVTGLGRGITFLDKEGQPVRNSILAYLDTRTDHIDGYEELNWGQSQIFKNLQWVKENQESIYQDIDKVVDARDYIGYELTGNLIRNNFGFPQEQLEGTARENGIPQKLFTESSDSQKPVGGLKPEIQEETGITDIPVYVAPWDAICSVIGSGLNDIGEGMVICGSTTVTGACLDAESSSANKPHLIEGKGIYLGAEAAGSAEHWFRNRFSDKSYEKIDSMIEHTSPAQGPLTLPFFKGGRVEEAPGTILEIDSETTEAELARSVVEAEAYFLREEFDELEENTVEIEEIRISGGGAQSHVRNKIRADVTGKPVKRLKVDETSALGAAMITAAAEQMHGSLEEAIENMTEVEKTVEPERSADYDTAYQKYVEAKKALKKV